MFTATTSILAAAGVLAAGAFIGTSAPGPTEPPQDPGASQEHRHDGSSGHRDMAQMHEQMMTEHPDMAQMHERMMAEHPDMARMHERMMGGMGGGMMDGDSSMGMR